MDLTAIENAKLGIYTLACHEWMRQLCLLREAIFADQSILDETKCTQLLNESLQKFFSRSTAESNERAADHFLRTLEAEFNYFRDGNENCVEVIGAITEGIRNAAANWEYWADLQEQHQTGRQFATRMFSDSLHGPKEPLTTVCQLLLRCDLPNPSDLAAILAQPFGYNTAPTAYRTNYIDEDTDDKIVHAILLRFTSDQNLQLYQALPFLFMHEYTAHIFAKDYENELFNDGWMLTATYSYLKKIWLDEDCGLYSEQVECFPSYLHARMGEMAQMGAWIAFQIMSQVPEEFMALTFEMAAFEPGSREEEGLPSDLINLLYRRYKIYPQEAIAAVKEIPKVRDLIKILTVGARSLDK